MTVSYINLMRVQAKPIMVMSHPGRSFNSAAEIIEAGRQVRERLTGLSRRRGAMLVDIQREPVSDVKAEPKPKKPRRQANARHGAPLDMLSPPSWRFLLKLACLRHKVPSTVILGPARTRGAVAARHYAICLIYQHTQCSLPQVGAHLGRDHTTVLYALEKHRANRKLVDQNPMLVAVWRPQVKQPVKRDMLWVEPSPGFGVRDTRHAEAIIEETCEKYRIAKEAVCSRSQAKAAITARHEAIYRISKETILSGQDIGALFGNRDHSTVTYSIRSHEARMAGEPLVWGRQVRPAKTSEGAAP
jgi:hypothetical protein